MRRDGQRSGPLTAGEARTLAAIMTGIPDPDNVAGFAIVVYLCTGEDIEHEHTICTTTDIADSMQVLILLASACNRINKARRLHE